MLSDNDRKQMRLAKGKHYDSQNNKIDVKLETTLAESQERQDKLQKRLKYIERKKQQSKDEFEKMKNSRIQKSKEMEQKFNDEFFQSEYEYQVYSTAPHQRTTIDLSFDEGGRKMTEEERIKKMFDNSRDIERNRAEETFGTQGGTTGWEGASDQDRDIDGFGDHEMGQREERKRRRKRDRERK